MAKRSNGDEAPLSSLPREIRFQIDVERGELIDRTLEYVLDAASSYKDEIPKRDGFHKMRMQQKKETLFWAINEAHSAREDLKRQTASDDDIHSAERAIQRKRQE